MKKAFLLITILCVSVMSTACINNLAVQELNNKAKVYLEKGDYENAISRLKSSLDLDSTLFETHYNLGIAYTQAEDYENAMVAFKEVLKLRPSFNDANYSLAVAQENFAKSIIDGSYKEKKDKDEQDIDTPDSPDKIDVSDDSDTPKKKELNATEKQQVVELYNAAIVSYQQYLKGHDIKDADDVNKQIESIQSDIEKYKSPNLS